MRSISSPAQIHDCASSPSPADDIIFGRMRIVVAAASAACESGVADKGGNGMMRRITLAALAAAAADLRLFGGGHFQGSGQPLVEAFSHRTGIAASYTPGNTGGAALKRRL